VYYTFLQAKDGSRASPGTATLTHYSAMKFIASCHIFVKTKIIFKIIKIIEL
jgi:hypothetical protein